MRSQLPYRIFFLIFLLTVLGTGLVTVSSGEAAFGSKLTMEQKMDRKVLKALDAAQDHAERFLRRPHFRRYTKLVKEAEQWVNQLRELPPQNMSFFLAVESCLKTHQAALESWRKAKVDDPEDYNIDIRNHHWKRAEEDLSRARSLIR